MKIDARREFENYITASKLNRNMRLFNFQILIKKMPNNILKDIFISIILVEGEDEFYENPLNFLKSTSRTNIQLFEDYSAIDYFVDDHILDSADYLISNLEFKVISDFLGKVNPFIEKSGFVTVKGFLKLIQRIYLIHSRYCIESLNYAKSALIMEGFIKNLIFNNKKTLLNPSTINFVNRFFILNHSFRRKFVNNYWNIQIEAANISVDVYEEQFESNYSVLVPYTNSDLMDIFYLVSFSHRVEEEKNSNVVVSQILKEMETRNLQVMDNNTIMRFLEKCAQKKIKFSNKIGEKILANENIFRTKFPKHLLLLIDTFQHSQIPLAPANDKIFKLFRGLTSEEELKNLNFNNLVILARCLLYFSDNRLKRHSIFILKRIIQPLLKQIEVTVREHGRRIRIEQIMDLATIFTRHLAIPNFLYHNIIERIDEIEINQTNRIRIRRLFEILRIRLQKSFTYSGFLSNGDVEYNSKWTPNSIQLIRVFLFKFRDTNLVSYHILASEILENKELLDNILVNSQDKKVHLGFLVKQLTSYIKSNQGVDILLFKPLMKIISDNGNFLNTDEVIHLYEGILSHLEKNQKNFVNINDIIPFLNYLVKGVSSLENSNLKPADRKKVNFILKKLKIFFGETIVPMVVKSSSVLIDKVKYNDSVSQIFNLSIFSSELKHFEYIPRLIEHLNYRLTPKTSDNFERVFERTCKRWKELNLVENLLTLSKRNMLSCEIIRKTLPSLFTVIDCYIETGTYKINRHFEERKIMDLIRILVTKINSNKDIFKDENLIILSILASNVMKDINDPEILFLLEALGSKSSNYSSNFIKALKNFKFSSIKNESEVIEFYSKFPHFCRNVQLHSKFRRISNPEKYTDNLIQLLETRHLYNVKYDLFIFDEFEAEEIGLRNLLDYLSITLPENVRSYHIDLLINKILLNEENLTRNQKEKILIIFQGLKFYRKNFNDLNFRRQIDKLFARFSQELLTHKDYGHSSIMLKNHEGELIQIKYFESLSLDLNTDETMNNNDTFMVNPVINTTMLDDSSNIYKKNSNNGGESKFFFNRIHDEFTDENELDVLKEAEEKKKLLCQKNDFFKYLTRYIIYEGYKNLVPEIRDIENEILLTKFYESQEAFSSSKKQNEGFTNFLVDITMILHNFDMSFETAYKCKKTGILLDIYIPEKKIGFSYLNPEEASYDLNGNNFKPLLPLVALKSILHEKAGIAVHFIEYNLWENKHPNYGNKENYLGILLE